MADPVSLVRDLALPAGDNAEALGEPEKRQPIFVVCSPRPDVGCTLISRLLVEYLAADERRPLAFDVNPIDRALARHLPLQAIPANLDSTRGEMALFDRLILKDGAPKVVDVGADLFDAFFDVMRHVGFAGEARASAIDLIILFVCAPDRRCVDAYRRLFMRRGVFTVVPVENAIEGGAHREMPLPLGSLPPIRIGTLPPQAADLIDRADFSFSETLRRPAENLAMHDWTRTAFVALRDLELRLQMAGFAELFRLA
jgi:hypothetical protein